jgi:hypothetical protein
MAMIFNQADEYLTATGLSGTNWTDYASGGTVTFWAKKTTGLGTGKSYGCPLSFSADATRTFEFAVVQNGSTLWQTNYAGSAGSNLGAWSNDQWIFFAFAKALDGTDKSVYYGTGAGLTEVTGVLGMGYNFARMTLGQTCNGDEASTQFEGKVAYVRIFNARLTDAEILAEANSLSPVKAANCLYSWPLVSNLNATTGAVNFVSAAGTATFDSDAPAYKKLKALVHPSAASATNVAGVVCAAPSASDITGTKVGEFTAQTFESVLDGSGAAVLKVPVTSFGGEALTVGATPAVLMRNATNTSGFVPGLIIEE